MNMVFSEYLSEHMRRHPYAEPRDVVKLCYQAAFGAEHLLLDIEGAREYFDEEFLSSDSNTGELFEQISPDFCRVNLSAWKREALPQAWLFEMFRLTAAGGMTSAISFSKCLQTVEALVLNGGALFPMDAWHSFFESYDAVSPVPVHHSETFRQNALPAYRIVSMSYAQLIPLLKKIAALYDGVKIISIDGRSAAGKTTLAETLRQITDAGIIHMDDFFLPAELRTEPRLNSPGGNVHYERFLSEVIPRLRSENAFSYNAFDCETMCMGAPREVGTSPLRIVEGAYSHHPELGGYTDLRVFCDIDADLQLQRIRARDGVYAEVFVSRWIPLEELYLKTYAISEKADVTLTAE